MPKRLHLKEHLTLAELEQRYRQARDPVARAHYQIVWLVGQGRLTREVASVTGYSPNWIGQLVRRYNAGGPAALGDGRQHNPGAPPLLSPAQQTKLRATLAEPPPDGGLWTSAKVAAWIADEIGHPVHVVRGWEYLRRLGYTPQVPRPRHPKADPAAQAAFKKTWRAA
jgi:transposase